MKKIPSGPASEKTKPIRLIKAGHDPRAAALAAISRVLAGEDSQFALDAVLQAAPAMIPTDKGLCTELTYGVLRRYLRLNWFSSRFLSRPDKLPFEMRLTLILALYELAYLRVPQHATLNWAVAHLRNRFSPVLGKVANGALRSMQRALDDFQDQAFYERSFAGQEQALAMFHAVPDWLFKLWDAEFGRESLALLEASARTPLSGLRLNRSRPDWQKLHAELLASGDKRGAPPLAVASAGLAFATPPWQARALIRDGRASAQSAASYAVLEDFSPSDWPQPIWDCCSGRGGKTLALLEQGIRVALASDLSRERLQALAREYVRLSPAAPCPALAVLDAAEPDFQNASGITLPENGAQNERQLADKPTAPFGTIIVDAPCSGLGTLARHPEIRWRRTPEDLLALASLQKRILASAWRQLFSGGMLVYLTCTLNAAENEAQVAAFSSAHADALLLKESRPDPKAPLGEFFYGAMFKKR